MALTLSGTNGVVGAGFTLDASGASVTAGVGTFSSIRGAHHGDGANLTSLPAAQLTGSLPALSAASLTSIPAANIVGVCTSGLTKTGGFGKVVQIKHQIFTTVTSITSRTEAASGIQIAMTPTDSSNKLIFSGMIAIGHEKDTSANFMVYIDSGSGYAVAEEARGPDRNNRQRATTGIGYNASIDDEEYMISMTPIHVILDCDNTNEHTIKLYWQNGDDTGRAIYINRTHNDNNEYWIPSYTSHFTLMEVQMS